MDASATAASKIPTALAVPVMVTLSPETTPLDSVTWEPGEPLIAGERESQRRRRKRESPLSRIVGTRIGVCDELDARRKCNDGGDVCRFRIKRHDRGDDTRDVVSRAQGATIRVDTADERRRDIRSGRGASGMDRHEEAQGADAAHNCAAHRASE